MVSAKNNTWKDAREFCKRIKGDLVSIRSKKENEKIIKVISSITLSDEYWIGLHKRRKEQTFSWTTGSSSVIRFWSNVEEEKSRDDCAAIIVKNASWIDYPCHEKRPFICKAGGNYCLIEFVNLLLIIYLDSMD